MKLAVFFGAGDLTDQLFHVNNASEVNPGRVTVTGTLDREAETTYTINIQVRTVFVYISPKK